MRTQLEEDKSDQNWPIYFKRCSSFFIFSSEIMGRWARHSALASFTSDAVILDCSTIFYISYFPPNYLSISSLWQTQMAWLISAILFSPFSSTLSQMAQLGRFFLYSLNAESNALLTKNNIFSLNCSYSESIFSRLAEVSSRSFLSPLIYDSRQSLILLSLFMVYWILSRQMSGLFLLGFTNFLLLGRQEGSSAFLFMGPNLSILLFKGNWLSLMPLFLLALEMRELAPFWSVYILMASTLSLSPHLFMGSEEVQIALKGSCPPCFFLQDSVYLLEVVPIRYP